MLDDKSPLSWFASGWKRRWVPFLFPGFNYVHERRHSRLQPHHPVVTVKEGRMTKNVIDITDGMSFDTSYISPYSVTDFQTQKVYFEKPCTLISEKILSVLQHILPVLDMVVQASLSGFPIFFSIFLYLFRIFPFYICVDILSVFFVWLSLD